MILHFTTLYSTLLFSTEIFCTPMCLTLLSSVLPLKFPTLRNTLLHSILNDFNAFPCTLLHLAALYRTLPHSTSTRYDLLHSPTLTKLYHTLLHYTLLFLALLHATALYCAQLPFNALFYASLHFGISNLTRLHSTALRCTLLHSNKF